MIALVLTGRVVVLTGGRVMRMNRRHSNRSSQRKSASTTHAAHPVQRALDWSLERRRQAILRRDDE